MESRTCYSSIRLPEATACLLRTWEVLWAERLWGWASLGIRCGQGEG